MSLWPHCLLRACLHLPESERVKDQADLDPILQCANKIQQVAGAQSTAATLACGGNGVNELFGKAWEVVSTCRLLLTLHRKMVVLTLLIEQSKSVGKENRRN